MRFVPLHAAFATGAKQKVLALIFDNYAPMSERQLAKVLEISHASVNRIMREFGEIDLVYSKRLGNVLTWEVNEKGIAYKELEKYARVTARIASPREHLIGTIREALCKCRVSRVVLFGSVAEGRERSGSDIDLFILVPNEQAKEELNKPLETLSSKCLELYGNPLMPYLLTESEFKHPSNPRLIENIMKGRNVLPIGA